MSNGGFNKVNLPLFCNIQILMAVINRSTAFKSWNVREKGKAYIWNY